MSAAGGTGVPAAVPVPVLVVDDSPIARRLG